MLCVGNWFMITITITYLHIIKLLGRRMAALTVYFKINFQILKKLDDLKSEISTVNSTPYNIR